jgi:hypothetical protein
MYKTIIELSDIEMWVMRKVLSIYWNKYICKSEEGRDEFDQHAVDFMKRLDEISDAIEHKINPLAGQTYYFTDKEEEKQFYKECEEKRQKVSDEGFIWVTKEEIENIDKKAKEKSTFEKTYVLTDEQKEEYRKRQLSHADQNLSGLNKI